MIASQLILFIATLLGSAFLAGIETGVISINRLRLQHLVRRRVPGAAIIRNFLAHPNLLLGTTLVGTNLLHVISAVLAASIGRQLYGATGTAIAGVLTALIILAFCEYIPKAWFQAAPARRTLPFARLLQMTSWVLYPISFVIIKILHWIFPNNSNGQTDNKLLVTREELLHLARESAQTGILTRHESDMIHGVFALTHKTCAAIMTPRNHMVTVPVTATAAEILDVAREKVFNRLPVYDPAQKKFVGVVHIFDILSDSHSNGKTAADYMRPPQQVASHTPVDHLLPRMRITRLPLFLVTDAKHEVIGLITLEDVLQEITGEE